jgi:tetratricopeptide (TPR) repeat protein
VLKTVSILPRIHLKSNQRRNLKIGGPKMSLSKHFLSTVLTVFALSSVVSVSAFSHGSDNDSEMMELSNTDNGADSNLPAMPQNLGPATIGTLLKEIAVESGYGTGWYFKTPKTEAEVLVNQGFAMLNQFQYLDAFRSFNTAQTKDADLAIAYIGKAFSAMNLDGSDSYFLYEAYNYILSVQSTLDPSTLAWANLYSSMVTGTDLQGNPLSINVAYSSLKVADPDNLEVFGFANWLTNQHNMSDYNYALTVEPTYAGVHHYLMHLAEGQNNHQEALEYAFDLVPLTLGSAHAQHMLGHVLPHFNRWEEADKQFEISHQLHLDWAKKNGVPAEEDWHYYHNLELLSITKMVINPAQAYNVLTEIERINPGEIINTLDFLVSTVEVAQKAGLENYFKQLESYSVEYKNYVLSSRLFFDLVFNANDVNVLNKLTSDVPKMANFKNKAFLMSATQIINLSKAGKDQDAAKVLNSAIRQLDANFSRGGFDGWQKSVITTLMYRKTLEVYGLNEFERELQNKIIDKFMNPIK